MSNVYLAVSRLAFIYLCSGSFPCCVYISMTKHMLMLMSCMWSLSISNLGLRDCMLTSVILSLVEFQNILSDPFSGHNK